MKQRRILALVVAIAVFAAAAGWFAGRQLKSSNEAQADVAAPEPSLITVAVESVSLESSVVVRGTVRFEGSTSVTVSGGLGPAVVTGAPPAQGDVVNEGDVFVEVTGRPVFVLAGELPMFRSMVPGAEGDDVVQFEEALQRLGYDVGAVDGVYDEALEQAVTAWYTDAGYSASGPTLEEQEQLSAAASAVTAARSALRSNEQALAQARESVPESTRLALDQSVRDAQRALDDVLAERAAAQVEADQERDAQIVVRDAGKSELADAQARLSQAEAGTHPDTGLTPTESELSELRGAVDSAAADLNDAELLLVQLANAAAAVPGQFQRQVEDATTQLAIQTASRRESLAGQDLSGYSEAIADANREVVAAQERLTRLETEIGIQVPATELVFLPTLPRRVESVFVERGSVISGAVANVSGVDLILDSSVPAGDRPLIKVGDRVVADDADLGVSVEGEIVFVADTTGTQGASSSRYYLRIRLDEGVDANELPSNLRVTVPFSSSDGEVLAVPLAAVSAAANGTPRVQVERSTGNVDVVDVVTGLRAGGLIEVRAVDGSLAEGDRVVVGFEGASLADDLSDDGTDESSAGEVSLR